MVGLGVADGVGTGVGAAGAPIDGTIRGGCVGRLSGGSGDGSGVRVGRGGSSPWVAVGITATVATGAIVGSVVGRPRSGCSPDRPVTMNPGATHPTRPEESVTSTQDWWSTWRSAPVGVTVVPSGRTAIGSPPGVRRRVRPWPPVLPTRVPGSAVVGVPAAIDVAMAWEMRVGVGRGGGGWARVGAGVDSNAGALTSVATGAGDGWSVGRALGGAWQPATSAIVHAVRASTRRRDRWPDMNG